MKNDDFSRWCNIATAGIKYRPDRQAVCDELQAHLEDHRDALTAQGLGEKEATEQALSAMGDPKVIAPQLAALHRPFWGYLLQVSKILLIILLCLSLYPIWNYAAGLHLDDTPDLRHFDIYDPASYGGDTRREALHLSQHEDSFSESGSTFTLTDAALITTTDDNGTVRAPQLYVRIRQTSLLPWTEHDNYFTYFSVTAWFSARDSLGNVYEGFLDPASGSHPMYTTGVQSGIFTYTHECWINDFPAEAEWVEIFYERDGRSYKFRITLTGGSTP